MLTLVIWAIGLYILWRLAAFTIIVVAGSFENSKVSGFAALICAFLAWIVVLYLIL